jgi:Ca2+-binding RTX toxin-like protein
VGNDNLLGGDGNDAIFGGDGNDYIEGNAGNDALTGGTGNDIFNFYLVSANDQDTITDFGAGDELRFNSASNASSPFSITSLNAGNTAPTSLATGQAVLVTGSGFTTLYVGSGNTAQPLLTTRLNGNLNTQDFKFSNFSWGAQVRYEPAQVTPGQTLTGTAGNDSLSGGSGDDTLDGGAGIDSLIGGPGNDTYLTDTQSDLVFESAGEGADTVISSVSFYLYAHIENLTLTGSAAFGVGNELDNVLTGNDQENLLIGWDGNDTLAGGAARDALFGVSGNDVLRLAGVNHDEGGPAIVSRVVVDVATRDGDGADPRRQRG